MASLEGKVALVTGGGRGLGLACAHLFAREGAKVVVAEIDEATGEKAAQSIRESGGDASFVRTDISSAPNVQAMVGHAVSTYGGLDCAVNNAVRFIDRTPLAEIADETWSVTANVNITGTFLCMKYEILAMLEGGGGAIVNVGSGRENTGQAGLSWYLGAKQAIYGMSRCAAVDYAGKGIRINTVAPGPMWTPALRETAEKIPATSTLISRISRCAG